MKVTKRALLDGAGQRSTGPRYALENSDEHNSLQRLKPSWGDRKCRRAFLRAVLVHLTLIARVRENEEPGNSADKQLPRNARVAESFKRRAKVVRNFVRRMQQPMSEKLATAVARRDPSWLPLFQRSRFPERELLNYAEACVRAEQFFSRYHTPSSLNAQIVKLLCFVRLHTGKPHFRELATLLKRPCGDTGMNAKRLDQLLRDRVAQYPDVRREAEQAKAGIGAFLVEQILSKSPAP
jgi:hypothetical protein